jgi:hypothetical protein
MLEEPSCRTVAGQEPHRFRYRLTALEEEHLSDRAFLDKLTSHEPQGLLFDYNRG